MMNSPAGRLTAREIIAKTFSAKARRGYDPAEVDAYLMDIARQVDELNLEIDRLTNEVVRLSFSQPATTSAAAPSPAPAPAPVAELPPPPPPAPIAPPEPIAVVPAPVMAPVMAPAPVPAPLVRAAAPVASGDQSPEEESIKLILKAAQKTAETTLTDARARAEEIIAEARYRASEITRESDRKAFEAASRIQTEIVNLEDQLTHRRGELESLHRSVESEKARVRGFAQDLLRSVGDEAPAPTRPANVIQLEPAPVVDLTNDNNRSAAAHEA
jgi:DivIVA domain-containing protein